MRARLLLAFLFAATPAFAVLPSEQLADPGLEARARAISAELRCVVCQNQTIDDSDAELAHDLRVLLRQRLKAGDTDQQAIAFLVNRYGDYVLLKPPFEAETLLLWLGPLLVLLAGGTGVAFYLKRRQGAAPSAFTADEQARLDSLLKEDAA
ncbi:MAG TPA: cytochrome c-type biogenesis protein [Rhizomicrobium sp.]|jgi:cytochrome c-type biogenesis protein CcmH|nr:cytochrome c-type biogenesis protein [Rhizomicrobium sp.]